MSTPTEVPFQDGEHGEHRDNDSTHAGRLPESTGPGERVAEHRAEQAAAQSQEDPSGVLLPPSQTETDLLAARVDGPDDHLGMTELWRATMALPHWWFVAVGDQGQESPAAATIEGKLMLMTFTNSERARHFAVQNGMISATQDLTAIALPPQEVVESAGNYEVAGIDGLMFDPHLSGYFIPSAQLPVVWDAVHADPTPSTEN